MFKSSKHTNKNITTPPNTSPPICLIKKTKGRIKNNINEI